MGAEATNVAAGVVALSGLSKERAVSLFREMCEIRAFEEKVYDLLGKNQIRGASHLYAGMEAVAVGAVSVLRSDDLITSTHRGHGHCHARGDSLAPTAEARQDHLNRMMAELCGRETGYCRGRGGSMHIADVEKGNLGATGIVGGNMPVATGAGSVHEAAGQRSRRAVLLWRRRRQHRQLPRGAEHGLGLEPAGRLHLREQPVRHVGAFRCRQQEPRRRPPRRCL